VGEQFSGESCLKASPDSNEFGALSFLHRYAADLVEAQKQLPP
jgi:hypothetical protein